nr:hypothetical protein Itr_chr05CG04410 [Ipomoea trifida]GMC99238.1 hypothetical protein Iba_chr05eCG3780 [Ipomoea batatas]
MELGMSLREIVGVNMKLMKMRKGKHEANVVVVVGHTLEAEIVPCLHRFCGHDCYTSVDNPHQEIGSRSTTIRSVDNLG